MYRFHFAEQAAEDVVVVDGLLDHLAAGMLVLAPPPDHGQAAQAGADHHADVLAVQPCLDPRDGVHVAALEADAADQALVGDGVAHVFGVGQIQGHGLLDEEVDTTLDGHHLHAVMGAGLHADIDRIQLLALEHVGVGGVGCGVEARGRAIRLLLDQVANGDHVHFVDLLHVPEVELGDTATTDESDFDLVHVINPLRRKTVNRRRETGNTAHRSEFGELYRAVARFTTCRGTMVGVG